MSSQPHTSTTAGAGPSRACQADGCENVVTADFARVYGAADGRVHACLECATAAAVRDGAAADPAIDRGGR